MIIIKLSIQTRKREVSAFLIELKKILSAASFCPESDLTVIQSRKDKEKMQYSTPYTLLDLGYQASDVAERLKELTEEEYTETLIDRDHPDPTFLFVFGKKICNRLVYIKVKIRGGQKKHVICVSFHYAEQPMTFPYT